MPQFESITLTHLGNDSHRYGLIRVWGSLGFIAVVMGFGWLIEGSGGAGNAHLLPWLMLPLFALLVGSAFANYYARDFHRAEGDASGFWQIVRKPQVLAFFWPRSWSSCRSGRTTRSFRSTWITTAMRPPRWGCCGRSAWCSRSAFFTIGRFSAAMTPAGCC